MTTPVVAILLAVLFPPVPLKVFPRGRKINLHLKSNVFEPAIILTRSSYLRSSSKVRE